MKIVIGGQVEKKAIEGLIKELDASIETSVKSDLDAAMAIKTGQADYYVGACHTGGGGALAMAIAMIGRDQCETVSIPGKQPQEEKVIEAVNAGKKAFGFTGDHMEKAIPMIVNALKNKA
ncbi:DUF2620 domain-containing protein [Oceanobacillus jordanicus]|uniref:DUF2620 domain-containing protein n=1 Tax=Oceanobacillus jordanicus TaxID=2867266 RepID=A0AAW5BB82_9BACI|nr:DUF2620 domain-containing protein [Oceanobacillus jordanicus]MCG3420416.1 DUF2620 domain-containing protein [Oceanobacillus jordanicus]